MAGDAEQVNQLLVQGADVNETDQGGCSSLFLAARQGCVSVVRLLLEAGADMNIVNLGGNTAVMRAVSAGHVDVVRLLLEADADVDVHHHVSDRNGNAADHAKVVGMLAL